MSLCRLALAVFFGGFASFQTRQEWPKRLLILMIEYLYFFWDFLILKLKLVNFSVNNLYIIKIIKFFFITLALVAGSMILLALALRILNYLILTENLFYVVSQHERRQNVNKQIRALCEITALKSSVGDSLDDAEGFEGQFGDDLALEVSAD